MAFPTTSVLDDFDRADGSPGSNWTSPVSFDASVFQIASNQASFSDSILGGYWNSSVTSSADCEVGADIPTLPASSGPLFYVRIASPGVALDAYDLRWGSASAWRLDRVDDGVRTQLGAGISLTISAGDSVGLEAIGSSISMYRKTGGSWSLVTSRTDSTYSAAGYIGWVAGDTTVRMDNFFGGPFGGGGGAPAATSRYYVAHGAYW